MKGLHLWYGWELQPSNLSPLLQETANRIFGLRVTCLRVEGIPVKCLDQANLLASSPH